MDKVIFMSSIVEIIEYKNFKLIKFSFIYIKCRINKRTKNNDYTEAKATTLCNIIYNKIMFMTSAVNFVG